MAEESVDYGALAREDGLTVSTAPPEPEKIDYSAAAKEFGLAVSSKPPGGARVDYASSAKDFGLDVSKEPPGGKAGEAQIRGTEAFGGKLPGVPNPPNPMYAQEEAPDAVKAAYIGKYGVPPPASLGTAFKQNAEDIAAGAERIANAQSGRERAGGASQVIRGGLGVVTGPENIVPALVAAPVGTAATIGTAMLTQKGTAAGLKAAGVAPEYSELAGDVAGLLAGAGGAGYLLRKAYVAAGSPEVKIGGKFAEPKPFNEMTDEELIRHANDILNNPPKNYAWQRDQVVQEAARRQQARGMGEGAPPAPGEATVVPVAKSTTGAPEPAPPETIPAKPETPATEGETAAPAPIVRGAKYQTTNGQGEVEVTSTRSGGKVVYNDAAGNAHTASEERFREIIGQPAKPAPQAEDELDQLIAEIKAEPASTLSAPTAAAPEVPPKTSPETDIPPSEKIASSADSETSAGQPVGQKISQDPPRLTGEDLAAYAHRVSGLARDAAPVAEKNNVKRDTFERIMRERPEAPEAPGGQAELTPEEQAAQDREIALLKLASGASKLDPEDLAHFHDMAADRAEKPPEGETFATKPGVNGAESETPVSEKPQSAPAKPPLNPTEQADLDRTLSQIADVQKQLGKFATAKKPEYLTKNLAQLEAKRDRLQAKQGEAEKPVTPQIPNEPGTKYVLSTFASSPGQRTAPVPAEAKGHIPAGHWMNEGEIDQAVERHKDHPVLARATKFLADLRDETNAHSDGWYSWPLPGHAAKQLMGMIQHPEYAAEENFKKALAPIKAFYTKRGNAAGMKWPEIAPAVEPPKQAVKAPATKTLDDLKVNPNGRTFGEWKAGQPDETSESNAEPAPTTQVETPETQVETPPNERTIEPGKVSAGTSEPEPTETRPAGPSNPEALEGEPSSDVSGVGEAGETARVGGKRGGELQEQPRGRSEQGAPVPVGGGAGEADRVPARRGDRPALTVEPDVSRDYRITPSDQLGSGGERTKANNNLAAIRILKAAEAEGREATPEEQAQLVKYVGWGQLSPIFDSYRREWAGVREELEKLLTDDEYASARKSTTNAHYTTPEVITGIYQALRHLGLAPDSRMLDPGSGISHFRGMVPDSLLPIKYTGVEMDPISGGIAKLLYPSANIQINPFEKTSLPNNYFDVAAGNVPFGNFGVHDAKYKQPLATRSIHNYFFVKSLDKLRPGGILAFVTSSFTMDEVNPAMRNLLASKANFLGAIRLPGGKGGAFAKNAGTEVTTDIILLQKRVPQTEASGEKWANLAPVVGTGEGGKATGIPVNEYYARHPEMMLGKMALEGTMYGPEKSKVLLGELTPEALAAAVAKLPQGVYSPAIEESKAFSPNPIHELPGAGEIKDGGFGLKGDTVIVREGDTYRPADLTAEQGQRVKGMLKIRDAVREVFRTQLTGAPEAAVEHARRALGSIYDKYVASTIKTAKGSIPAGPLNSPANIKAMAGDPDAPLLASLENYSRETGKATKRDIFSKRTIEKYTPIEHVENASEALAVSLAETGRIDWARMQELTGKTPDDMRTEMGNLVFRNPEGHAWETQDEYLSGNVRAKLQAAEVAAKTDPAYQRNVEALRAVQPKDLTPGQINARLGASWIPTADVRDFIGDLLGVSPYSRDEIRVSHAGVVGHWGVTLGDRVKSLASNTDKWGHGEMTAGKLIEGALNLQAPTIYKEVWVGPGPNDTKRVVDKKATLAAQDKQEKIREEWKKWLWSDGDRANRLSRQYNDEFNNLRLREYDGSHLKFPGMARMGLRNGDLDAHQKNAIWRQIQGGNTLLAHVVGAGKTFEMIAAGMEMKRLGLIKKPMYVVPNRLVEQWGGDFLRLYPSANIFIAGKEHFSTGNRQKAMSRIATGNYDAVIVAHRSFQFLPVSDATFEAFMHEQMTDIDNALHEAALTESGSGGRRGKGGKSRSVKELEKARARLEKQLEDRAKREASDKTIDFEQLGVDQIFVDEADMFKNLYYASKMTRVAGLPNSQSNRAMDMFIKSQYLTRLNNGKRGVVFATGTPIANSMAEMYTMQRYLSMAHLKETGVQAFDSWVQNFATPQTGMELAPEGTGYRMNTRFTKFINVAELLTAFRSFADVKNAEDLNLPRPALKTGKPIIISVPASPELKEFVKGLGVRAEAIRSGKVKPWDDNMLAVVGDGRKAALDMRLVEPGLPDNQNSKVQVAVSKVAQIWKDTEAKRSTQLMFLDLGTPRPTDIKEKDGEPVAQVQPEDGQAVSTYQDIKNKLIAKGIPAKEIAFIHDVSGTADTQVLFDNVKTGRIRILIGSTEKMGAGMNVQDKLIALHHLDVPWRPRDIEQRDGRGLRQGNENPEIAIHRYVTEDSFDAYMWQMILAKATTVKQAMSGDLSVREIEDVGIMQMSASEAMAASTGSPEVRERIGLGMDVQRLEALAEAHADAQRGARMEVASLPRKIAGLEQYRGAWEKVAAQREAWPKDQEPWSVKAKGFAPKDATERNQKLLKLALSMTGQSGNLEIGSYKGFPVVAVGRGEFTHREGDKAVTEPNPPAIEVNGHDTYFRPVANAVSDQGLGLTAAVRYDIDQKPDAEIRRTSEQIATAQGRLRDLQSETNQPFDQQAKLTVMKARLKELNDKLDIDKADAQAVDLEEGAEAVASGTPAARELPATGSKDEGEHKFGPESGAAPMLMDLANAIAKKLGRPARGPQREKDPWRFLAQRVNNLSDEDLLKAYHDDLAEFIHAVDGQNGIPENISAVADKIAAEPNAEALRVYLSNAFEEASDAGVSATATVSAAARNSAGLKALKDADDQLSDKRFGEKSRTFVTGERDIRVAEGNQLRDRLKRMVPDPKQQEAISLMRDFKERPGELEQFRDGTHQALNHLPADERKEAMDRIARLAPVIDLAIDPTPEMLKADAALTQFFTAHLKEGKKLGMLESSLTNEEYITHLLAPKPKPGVAARAVSALRGRSGNIGPKKFRYAKERKIPTLLHAVAYGVPVRTLNAFDAMTIYNDKYAASAAARLFEAQIKRTGVGKWGTAFEQRAGEIPADWVELAPETGMYRHQVPYLDKEGNARIAQQHLFVPPELEKAMRPVFQPDYLHHVPGYSKSRMYQGYIKATELSLSAFHIKAMNLAALANDGPTGMVKAWMSDMESPEFEEAERRYVHVGLETPILGRTVEAYKALTPSSLPTGLDKVRSAPLIHQVDLAAQAITHLTFDVLQRKFKVIGMAQKEAAWLADHPDATPGEHYEALRGLAKEVNAVFGGLHWENMGVNRTSLGLARLLMLAPDWTFSNWLTAKYAFEGPPKIRTRIDAGEGNSITMERRGDEWGAGGNAARMFWIKGGILLFGLTAATSLLLSGKLAKDPTRVNMGKDKSGKDITQNIYFTGAWGDLANALHYVGRSGLLVGSAHFVANKLGNFAKATLHQLANADALGRPIAVKGESTLKNTVRGGSELAKDIVPVPFGLSTAIRMARDPKKKYSLSEYLGTVLGGIPPTRDAPAKPVHHRKPVPWTVPLSSVWHAQQPAA